MVTDRPQIRVVRRHDAEYPRGLLDLKTPPEPLFVRGDVEILNRRPAVAIIGARKSSEQGRDIARSMARDLALAQVTIVSGGALGIDGEAHQGAVDAASGTIVVLPGAVDHPLPRCHADLFDAVLAFRGALLSEVEGGVLTRSAFCLRNRLVAALADVVIVVEARAQSGTLHTVRAARRVKRTIAAVPWSITDPRGSGCVELLRRDARAVASADDVIRILRSMGFRMPPAAKAGQRDLGRADLPHKFEGEVLRVLREGLDTPEKLAGHLDRPLQEVLGALTSLEIWGHIRARGGRFERNS